MANGRNLITARPTQPVTSRLKIHRRSGRCFEGVSGREAGKDSVCCHQRRLDIELVGIEKGRVLVLVGNQRKWKECANILPQKNCFGEKNEDIETSKAKYELGLAAAKKRMIGARATAAFKVAVSSRRRLILNLPQSAPKKKNELKKRELRRSPPFRHFSPPRFFVEGLKVVYHASFAQRPWAITRQSCT